MMFTLGKYNWAGFLSLFVLFSCLFAGNPKGNGTSGAAQLLQPVGAKGIATFGANIATINSTDALYWNPAGLSAIPGKAEAAISTMTIFNDIRVNYAAVAYKTDEMGVLAFSLKTFDFGDIPVTTIEDMDGESGQFYSPTFVTAGFSYSICIGDKLNLGFNTKVVHESLIRASATAVAFDFGIQYKAFAGYENFSLAVVIKNIGTDMTYNAAVTDQTDQLDRHNYLDRNAAANDLPGSIEMGFGYEYHLDSDNVLTTTTDFQSNNFSSDAVKIGLEYSFRKFVMLRAGYNYETDLAAKERLYRFALGAGIKYTHEDVPISIDYAYRDSQYFEANNIFSFTIGF